MKSLETHFLCSVSYLGYVFLKEMITTKVIVSLLAVLVGLYFVKKADIKNVN